MRRLNIKNGTIFGHLTTIGEGKGILYSGNRFKRRTIICKCDCGKEKEVVLFSLLNNDVKSCGCRKDERLTKNGILKKDIKYLDGLIHPMYNSWNHIKDRCNNKTNRNYKHYGGRGITYDPRREDFEGFYDDMKEGWQKGLSIDRIDNNGNYYKENCRWATNKEQQRNRRNNNIYKGKCIAERAEIWGVTDSIAHTKVLNLLKKEGKNSD